MAFENGARINLFSTAHNERGIGHFRYSFKRDSASPAKSFEQIQNDILLATRFATNVQLG